MRPRPTSPDPADYADPLARLMPTRPAALTADERAAARHDYDTRRAEQMRAARRLSIRERVDRELRPVVRLALLGDNPLPTPGWQAMSAGRTRPATHLFERGLEARLNAKRARSAADVRAGLHEIADNIADLIERELPRAA